MSEEFSIGDAVVNATHGPGSVHLITNDKTFPVIVKFKKYPVINYYYSQDGEGLTRESGTIKKQ